MVLLSELAEQVWLPAVHMPAGVHDRVVVAGHWQYAVSWLSAVPLQSLSEDDVQLREPGPTDSEQLPQLLVVLSALAAQVWLPALHIPFPS